MVILLAMLQTSCYRFTDVSFPENLKSVAVQNFDNQASFVVPGLTQTITEALKDKFLRETNVFIVDGDGDWNFEGLVTRYTIDPIAPTGDETTALNRITITISVAFSNNLNEEASWTSSFSRFADFESTRALADVEEELIDEITEQLTQDIFNKLSDW